MGNGRRIRGFGWRDDDPRTRRLDWQTVANVTIKAPCAIGMMEQMRRTLCTPHTVQTNAQSNTVPTPSKHWAKVPRPATRAEQNLPATSLLCWHAQPFAGNALCGIPLSVGKKPDHQ